MVTYSHNVPGCILLAVSMWHVLWVLSSTARVVLDHLTGRVVTWLTTQPNAVVRLYHITQFNQNEV